MNGFEIEKRYFIAYPKEEALKDAKKSEIVQTYLNCQRGSERVRKRTTDGVTVYTHNKKVFVGGFTRKESEETIGEAEYLDLLKKADPTRLPIEKIRYVLPWNGLKYEIDVYPFWSDKAILEIELPSENYPFEIPKFLTVLEDITTNGRYTNQNLAKKNK